MKKQWSEPIVKKLNVKDTKGGKGNHNEGAPKYGKNSS